jgi:NADPH-dependent curcumin reductase CurA
MSRSRLTKSLQHRHQEVLEVLGSKTERGSLAYATLKTVFCTLAQRTESAVDAFAGLLKGQPFPPPGHGC